MEGLIGLLILYLFWFDKDRLINDLLNHSRIRYKLSLAKLFMSEDNLRADKT